jgi:hypothetical protein
MVSLENFGQLQRHSSVLIVARHCLWTTDALPRVFIYPFFSPWLLKHYTWQQHLTINCWYWSSCLCCFIVNNMKGRLTGVVENRCQIVFYIPVHLINFSSCCLFVVLIFHERELSIIWILNVDVSAYNLWYVRTFDFILVRNKFRYKVCGGFWFFVLFVPRYGRSVAV